MKDWGELWLNEGFATYFENVGASIVRPDFAYYETFYSDLATSALEEDSYPKSTHPLATLSGTSSANYFPEPYSHANTGRASIVLSAVGLRKIGHWHCSNF